MKALLIDVHKKEVTEVIYPAEEKYSREMYKRFLNCDCITTVQIDRRNMILLDDEGLLKDNPGPFFSITGYPQPLCGNGLVVGVSEDGETVNYSISAAELRSMIAFPAVRFTGFTHEDGYRDHPIFGNVFVSSTTANFEPLEEEEKK